MCWVRRDVKCSCVAIRSAVERQTTDLGKYMDATIWATHEINFIFFFSPLSNELLSCRNSIPSFETRGSHRRQQLARSETNNLKAL